MGTHGLSSNHKKSQRARKPNKLHRLRKAEKKHQRGELTGEVNDKELMTGHILRKRRTCPRANITLSGKKKRRLLKQLKHMQTEKSQMEVEVAPSSSKKSKRSDVEMAVAETTSVIKDVEMKEQK